MKETKTNNAPAAIGPYSQAITVGNMLFTSGQIPINPATGDIPEGVEAQAEQALTNVKNLIEAAGGSIENVVKTTVFITKDDQEIPMNGKTTSSNLLKWIGSPQQNTDGHWHYTDDQGYKYEFVTENQKGILTRVAITYPTN